MAPRYALDDSESESEAENLQAPPQPSDKQLESALRKTVADIFKTGKTEELTVKRVRLAAEKTLQIEEGFFKSNADWKTRSDQIIKDEVEIQDAATQELGAEEKNNGNARSPSPDTVKSAKRANPKAPSAARKRRKMSGESDAEEQQNTESMTKVSKRSTATLKSDPEDSDGKVQDDSDDEKDDKFREQKEEPAGDSESEMSVVLDEEPQPKRQRQKKSTGSTTTKAKKKAPAKTNDADADPSQAEIKRLQGWLIKCGIRKMWARELAPYDTPKAKIKHLKDMLKDVGMEGRYSLEKARQIKEERELREDLEMVQEGAKRWGKGSEDEGSDDGQPRRRLNRGRKALAFLESDGEETD
ncbi:hypothetical protein BDV18DRAFT_130315 [Aspergillus unguis]